MAELQVRSGTRQILALNAVTAAGAGAAADLEYALAKFTLQTKVTGAPTAVSVNLEGSLDGVNFFVLGTSTSTSGDAQFITDKACRYVRGNLTTLTGGTAPTVTALFVAV